LRYGFGIVSGRRGVLAFLGDDAETVSQMSLSPADWAAL